MKTNKELLLELVNIMQEHDEVEFDAWPREKDGVKQHLLNTNILENKYKNDEYKTAVLNFLSDNNLKVEDIENVYDERSSEGDHNGWETVIRVRDQYFIFYGWYDSNEGTEMTWDECDEVVPTEVTTVVYTCVK